MTVSSSLLSICEAEWQFFGHSLLRLDGTTEVGLKEYEDGAWQRVGDYWRALGGPYRNLTGKDRGIPWSASFISWCMREAGAGTQFPYSAGHAIYINHAIRNGNDDTAGLVGRRPAGYKLNPGDLIGYWRGAKKITFDNARTIGWYDSHTDIVVDVAPGKAVTIGGNVMHSVTKREVRLGSKGDLIDRSQNWFVVIQNNL